MHVQAMISSHPQLRGEVNRTLVAAIEAAYVCAQTCTPMPASRKRTSPI